MKLKLVLITSARANGGGKGRRGSAKIAFLSARAQTRRSAPPIIGHVVIMFRKAELGGGKRRAGSVKESTFAHQLLSE